MLVRRVVGELAKTRQARATDARRRRRESLDTRSSICPSRDGGYAKWLRNGDSSSLSDSFYVDALRKRVINHPSFAQSKRHPLRHHQYVPTISYTRLTGEFLLYLAIVFTCAPVARTSAQTTSPTRITIISSRLPVSRPESF